MISTAKNSFSEIFRDNNLPQLAIYLEILGLNFKVNSTKFIYYGNWGSKVANNIVKIILHSRTEGSNGFLAFL